MLASANRCETQNQAEMVKTITNSTMAFDFEEAMMKCFRGVVPDGRMVVTALKRSSPQIATS